MAISFNLQSTTRKLQVGHNYGLLMKVCERGTSLIKSIQNGYLFCQNGIQKYKGLDRRTEPLCAKLLLVFPRVSSDYYLDSLLVCLYNIAGPYLYLKKQRISPITSIG